MADLGPVELPYGLSKHHRYASRTGSSLALPCSLLPRWRTPSLRHWSQAGISAVDMGAAASAPHIPLAKSERQRTRKRPAETNPDHESSISKANEPTDYRMQPSVNKRARASGKHKAVVASQSNNRSKQSLSLTPIVRTGGNELDVSIRPKTSHTIARVDTASRAVRTKTLRASPSSTDNDPDDVELKLIDIPDFEMRLKVAQLMAIAPAFSVSDLYHLLVQAKGQFEPVRMHIVPKTQEQQTIPRCEAPANLRATLPQTSTPVRTEVSDGDNVMIKIDWDDPELIYDNDVPDLPPHEVTNPKKRAAKKKHTQHEDKPQPKEQAQGKKPQPKNKAKKLLSEKRTQMQKLQLKKQAQGKTPRPEKQAQATKLQSEEQPPPNNPSFALPKITKNNISYQGSCSLRKPSSSPLPSQTHTPNNRANTSAKRTTHTPSNVRETSSDREFLAPDEHVLSDSDQSYLDSEDESAKESGSSDDEEAEDGEENEVEVLTCLAFGLGRGRG